MEGIPRAVGNLAGKEKNDTKKQKNRPSTPRETLAQPADAALSRAHANRAKVDKWIDEPRHASSACLKDRTCQFLFLRPHLHQTTSNIADRREDLAMHASK